MKKYRKGFYGILLLTLTMLFGMTAQAKTDDTIKTGIYAGDVELSGMTAQEATAVIEEHIEGLKDVEITLLAANDHDVTTTAGDLGVTWKNPELVQEALELGTHGNVIERYKTLMDLQHENYVYPIELDFDLQAINDLLTRCTKYDQEAINVSLKRDGGKFTVVEGQTGYVLDVEKSIDAVYDYLTEEWNHEACSIPLEIVVDEPKGSAEELAQVTDVLGSFTTSYKTSGSSRSANVANGCSLINGTTLYPGEEFSTYKTVSPFSVANGYYMAGSYVSGKVVDSLGGGICQVSTTLYNAVLLAELEVTERYNHSMIVGYVDPSADAAIAESSGKDFKFVNNTDAPIYIEGYTSGKNVYFNIYGEETRPANRKVTYESEVVSEQDPGTQFVATGDPVGTMSVSQGKHVGYVAQLWKVVTVDGVEESREVFNKSTYKASPKIVNVGTASEDPNASATIGAALATGDEGTIYAAVAQFTAAAAATPEQPAENQSAEEQAIVGDGQVDVSGDNGGNGQ